MFILRSERQNIYGMDVNKTSLSAFDTKRWIEDDGVHTNAFGYNLLPTEAEMEEIEEWFDGVFGPPIPTEAELEGIDEWLRAYPGLDQAGVLHVISRIATKLDQNLRFTQKTKNPKAVCILDISGGS